MIGSILSVLFCDTKNFLENRRVPLPNFSFQSCETNFFEKIVMTRPFPCMKSFDKKDFWNTKLFCNEIFWYSGGETFRRKTVIPPPLLSIKNFSLPEFFWNRAEKASPMNFFGTVRKNIIDVKFWYSPPPNPQPPTSYPQTFSLPEVFWNTYQKGSSGSSTKILGTVRQKNFDTKTWHNSLKRKISRHPNLATHWRVSLRKLSALCVKKNDRKSWYYPPPSPLLYKIFFDTRKFENKRVPLRNFSALWDNKFSIENRDFPLSGIRFFDIRIFLKRRRVPRRTFFGTVRRMLFNEK